MPYTNKKENIIVNDRTLVKISASEYCIGFKTISRKRKSKQRFLVTRDELARLAHEQRIITRDIYSFAVLRRDTAAGTLSIGFSWLNGGCSGTLTGWEETVTLPYDMLMNFVEASAQEGGPRTWEVLSIQQTETPQLIFVDAEGLRKCLENRAVRGKLVRALRDNFHGYERVVFYHDFAAYSFMFRSFRGDQPFITGGLIFHDYQNELKKAYYSVHT